VGSRRKRSGETQASPADRDRVEALLAKDD
jgi:hypothetical protein